MKRTFLGFLVAVACILAFAAPGLAATPVNTVSLDGRPIRLDPMPYVDGGNVMLPLRSFFENMGATVAWSQDTMTATASLPGATVNVGPDSKAAKIDGSSFGLSVVASDIDGRLYVPLDLIKAACSLQADWNGTTGILSLSRKGTAGNTLYQVSAYNDLLNGQFDGSETIGDLRQHGDFGLGTFDGLNGEMIEQDGVVYQVRTDGVAYQAPDSMTTPFADVLFFQPDQSRDLVGPLTLQQLQQQLDGMIGDKNIFYAIKVTGKFSYAKTRSESKQQQPYPTLTAALKNQVEFELHDVQGTLTGFWSPAYSQGVCASGYHLHMLTADKKAGGHLLDLLLANAQVQIEPVYNLDLCLPQGIHPVQGPAA